MSYSQRRHETLRRLGIEQLPTLCMVSGVDNAQLISGGDFPVRTLPVSHPLVRTVPAHDNRRVGARPQMPKLRIKGTDSMGYSRQTLSSVWHTSQLKFHSASCIAGVSRRVSVAPNKRGIVATLISTGSASALGFVRGALSWLSYGCIDCSGFISRYLCKMLG